MRTKAHLSDLVTERESRNQQLSYDIATEGIVLLENDGTLPLAPCKIALYGAGALYTLKGGSGSGEVNVRHNVTVLEGMENAGFEVVTHDWIDRYDRLWKSGKEAFLRAVRRKLWWPTAHLIDELMAAEYRFPAGDLLTEEELSSCGADTCVYVLSRQSGEGHDVEDKPGSFRMDSTEEHNIRLCAAHFARFVLVINTGCPVDLSPLDNMPGVNAIVYMGQLGMEGGNALAAILTGKSNPSGKLAVTWPKRYDDVPFGDEFGDSPVRALYKEGIYVGYRYYDSFEVAPRYPFGYGLSYTAFEIEPLKTEIVKNEVQLHIRVTNSGQTHAGKEVVQLYARCPGDDCEYQRLVAFGKTALLAPGKAQELTLTFRAEALSCYLENEAQTVLNQGEYLLLAGTSSRLTKPVAALRIAHQIVLARHKHLCAPQTKVTHMHHANTFSIPESLPVLSVNEKDFTARNIDYTPAKETFSEETVQALNSLAPQDLVRFCAGTGMSGEKGGFCTPGAVGHTTTAYIERSIPNVEMCDGPAGVRLEKRAVLYPDGDIRALDLSISIYEFFPRFLLRWFVLGDPKKGQLLYQFVTGFPIEAMVAQTWNTGLAEAMGKAVGEEMSEYGVTFWLAPAMNIVRNPLCGRNYEYYSEDPLMTGLMASAVTKGVQAKEGLYVTIKHFCANNQEAERYTVSSEVDERALREIYWKGFEIAVKNAHPRALMTAYNKVNGVYCANSAELCTELLRNEWGFEGVVMTDWMSTGKDRADEAKAVSAGVDLIMPGGKKEIKALLEAYKKNALPEADIRRAAGRVITAILHSIRHFDA